MKKILNTLLFLLISGVAISQTTVTLQDQCNCEVLSGTDVSTPGVTTPTGADLGDIYVNTNTGTIFFWDGDSWELTSGNDANTTNATLTEDGVNLILTDSDNNTVTIALADIAAVVDTNTTNTAFTVNTGTGQLEITDSDNNTVFVSLADLATAIDTDNQNASEVAFSPSGTIASNNVQEALEELDAKIVTNSNELTTTVVEGTGIDVSSTVSGNNTEYTVGINLGTIPGEDLTAGDGSITVTDGAGATLVDANVIVSADGITNAKLADNAVDTENIVNGGVGTDDLAADAVDNSKLADGAVQLDNLADGTTAGELMQWNGTDWVLIDGSSLDTDTQYTAGTGLDLTGTEFSVNDSELSPEWGNLTGVPSGFSDNVDDVDDADADITNELTLLGSGAPTSTPGNTGVTYVDTAAGQLYIWDGAIWNIVGGSATPGDASDTNELITSFGINGANLRITEAGNDFDVPLGSLGTDDQTLSLSGTDLSIADGNTIDISSIDTDTDDQTLSLTGNTLSIADGNSVDLSGFVDTDDQTLSLSGTDLSIADGNTIDISSIDTDTDDQTLSLSGTDLSIADGNTIDISGIDTDTDDQTLSLSGTDLSIADGNTIDISSIDTDTDDQTLSLSGTDLSISDGNTIDISSIDTDTDDQTLSLSGTDLSIADGNTIDISSIDTDDQTASEVTVADAGGNFTNGEVEGVLEEIDARIDALVLAGGSDGNDFVTGGSLSGTDLTLNVPNQIDPVIDLSGLQDGTGTDDQTLSLSGTDLSISDGNTIDISSIDTDTDDQTLSLTGNTLSIADGNSVDLSGFVDTDDQTLSLSGTDLSISDGNTIDISSIDTDTDDQTASEVTVADAGGNFTNGEVEGVLEEIDARIDALVLAGGSDGNDFVTGGSLSGTDLTLNVPNQIDPVIDLSGLQDGTGTDDQTLSLSGTDLSISDGNTIDISSIDTDTDDQTLSLSGTDLSISDGNTIDISGIDTDTDDQTLSLSGTDLSIADGNTIDISSIDTDTDDQTLSLTGNTLSIADGNSVDLSGFVDTDDQTLSLSGTDLSISDGNTIDISGIDTDTDDQTLSLSGTDLSIADGNTIDISSIDTDDQTASEVTVADAGGNFTNGEVEGVLEEIDARIDALVLAGGSDGNDFVTGGSLSGTDLTLNVPNQIDPVIDLSGLQDGTGTDDQTLSLSGTDLSIADGNTIDISSIDTDTDDQTLSLSGTDLSISDGNTIDISGIDTDTDDQTLSLSGTDLSIADGNTIDISSIDTDTDDQTLSLSGTDLSISDGNTIDISSIDTDNQTLSLSGTDLSIADGNTIDISSIDTDDQTASEVTVADAGGNFTNGEVEGVLEEIDARIDALVLAGGSDGNDFVTGGSLSGTDLTLNVPNQIDPVIDLSGLQDGTGTDDQTLSLSGKDLSISDGNTIDISSIDTDTDDQTLSLSGTDLSISDGNTIDISSIDTDTDDQTLSLSGTDLSIADGNTIDISSIDTDTDDQTLNLTGNTLSIADGNSVDLSGFCGHGRPDALAFWHGPEHCRWQHD